MSYTPIIVINETAKEIFAKELHGIPTGIRFLYNLYTAGIRDVYFSGDRVDLPQNVEEVMNISYSNPTSFETALLSYGCWLPYGSDMATLLSELEDLDDNSIIQNDQGPVVYKISRSVLDELHFPITEDELMQRLTSMDITRIPREDVLRISDEKTFKEAERKLVETTQKGIHLTSQLNAPMENLLVNILSKYRWITPWKISTVAYSAFAASGLLFLQGDFLPGALVGYAGGIIDGVDGKLARIRGFLTKGGRLEHSFDALFEQLMYASYFTGLSIHYDTSIPLIMGIPFLISDMFVRHLYMNFKDIMGTPLKTYSRFDEIFGKIDGRRNVYLLYALLSSAVNRPLYGLGAALVHSLLTGSTYLHQSFKHTNEADIEIQKWVK